MGIVAALNSGLAALGYGEVEFADQLLYRRVDVDGWLMD